MRIKSQSAIEFVVTVSFMLLVVLIFFGLTSSEVLEAEESGNKKIAEDIANLAYQEIEFAKYLNDGYIRTFSMPQTVNGVDYSINIIDNRELVVNYLGFEYVKFIPGNVIGNIKKDVNVLLKEEGKIFLNTIGFSTTLASFIMKNNLLNVIRFDDDGSVTLKNQLQQNHANPPVSGSDEFVFKDRNGNVIAVINLESGNMFIKGSLFQNQPTLSPQSLSSDFVVRGSDGSVISYIDEFGNFYLKGILTENGNP